MGSVRPLPQNPELQLQRALEAGDPATRLRCAEAGLGPDVDPDLVFLLLRQAYLAHLELRQFRRALEVCQDMVDTGVMADVAYTDLSRAHMALGDAKNAIDAQRLASRNAPTVRRSFQYWSLATLQHFAGDVDGALATLKRGLRYAQKDRLLLKAHRAYIRLDAGMPVRGLHELRADLSKSKCGEGYGRFLQGMIAHLLGDRQVAQVQLQAFLRRNSSIDEAKRLTLREELRRARLALAAIASD